MAPKKSPFNMVAFLRSSSELRGARRRMVEAQVLKDKLFLFRPDKPSVGERLKLLDSGKVLW